jgi:hypothetical protein
MVTRDQILAAFPETRYDGSGSLGKFLSHFTDAPSDPLNEVKGWTEVTPTMLIDGPRGDIGGLLMFMPPDMWLHFLPAWLSALAEFGGLVDGVLTGAGITLVPELLDATFNGQDAYERLSMLSSDQVELVRMVGGGLASDPDIAKTAGFDVGKGMVASMESLRQR